MQSYANQFLHRALASAADQALGRCSSSQVQRSDSDSTFSDSDQSVAHLMETAAAAYQATSAGKRAQCESAKTKLISEKSLAEATARRCQKIQSKIDQLAQEKELHRLRTLQERKERFQRVVEQTRPTVRKRPTSSRIRREQETLRTVQGEAVRMVDAAIDNPVPTAYAAEVTSMLKYKGMWDGSHQARIVKGSAVEVAESTPNNLTDKRLETASAYSSPASSRSASPSHPNQRRPASPNSARSRATPVPNPDSRNPTPMPTTPRPHSATTYPVPLPINSTKKSLTPIDPTATAPSMLTPIHDSLVPPVFPPDADFSDDDECDLPLGPRPGRGRRGTKKISQKALQLLESNLRLKANRALENMTVSGGGGNTSDDRDVVVPRLLQPFPRRNVGNRAVALREGKGDADEFGSSSRPSSGVSSSTTAAVRGGRPESAMPASAGVRPGSARLNAFFVPLDKEQERNPRAVPPKFRPASDSSTRAFRPRFANDGGEANGKPPPTANTSNADEDLLEDPVAAWKSTPASAFSKAAPVHGFPRGFNPLAGARHLTWSEPTLNSERQEDLRLNSSARMAGRLHSEQQRNGSSIARGGGDRVGSTGGDQDEIGTTSKRQVFSAPTGGKARPGTASRRTQDKLQITLESIEAFLDPRNPPPSPAADRTSQQRHSIATSAPSSQQQATSRIPLPTLSRPLSFESVAGTPGWPPSASNTRKSKSAPPPTTTAPLNAGSAGLKQPTRLTMSARPLPVNAETDDVPTRILKRIVPPAPPTQHDAQAPRTHHRAHFSADLPAPPPPSAPPNRVSHDAVRLSGNTQLVDEASLVASLTRLSAEIDSRLSQLGVMPAPSLFSSSAASASSAAGVGARFPTARLVGARSSGRVRGSADTLASVEAAATSVGGRRMGR